MTTLVLASRNAHKLAEIRAILSGPFQFLCLNDFKDVPSVAEDQDTFAGNAARKSVHLADWLAQQGSAKAELEPNRSMLVLADDSGLEVDALGGAPGVHSARFAALDTGQEGNSPDQENNAKLLRLLEEVPTEQRTARFRCVLAATAMALLPAPGLARVGSGTAGGPRTWLFEGVCEGSIGFAAAGQGGFGYDPLFLPRGCTRTFAELGETEKNRISHRARALEKLRDWLMDR